MASLAQAYSARKWPSQICTQLLTNCTEIAWGLYTLGTRERALPGVQRSEFTANDFYDPWLGKDSESHLGGEKGDRAPCGIGRGAAGMMWTVPEATAGLRVVSAQSELEPQAGAHCSNFLRK